MESKRRIIFELGASSGFFSEIFYMIRTYLYCKKYKYVFAINSSKWLYKHTLGWHDYFTTLEETHKTPNDIIQSFAYTPPELYGLVSNGNLNVDFTLKEYQLALHELFILTPDLEKKKQHILEELSNTYTSIFIRRGDKLIKEAPYIPVQKILEECNLQNFKGSLFIQSDDSRVVDECKTHLPISTIYSTVDRQKHGSFHSSITTKSLESIKNETEEMIVGLFVCLNAAECWTDITSNVGRFLKLYDPEKVHTYLKDIHLDLDSYHICPSFYQTPYGFSENAVTFLPKQDKLMLSMKTILFVTAFRDIHRESWDVIPRTVEEYIRQFMNLANTIQYRLIVFINPTIRRQLESYTFYENMEFHDLESVPSFYDKYIDVERTIISSEEFQKKVPEDRKKAPEHWCAEYTMVNHSKINYVKKAKEIYPNYTYYSWLDFGCIRNTLLDVPMHCDLSKLEKKITYLALKMPTTRRSPEEMVASHDVYLSGSQFILHTDLIDTFHTLYENKILEFQKQYICDEDQGIVLQLYYDNPDLFQLFESSEWFSLFRNYLNVPISYKTRQTFCNLINTLGFETAIEIGVARGQFSKLILSNTNIKTLYAIDPYKNFSIDEYTDGMNYYNMDNEFEECKKFLHDYLLRIQFIRKLSDEAVYNFSPNSIDFCYIDGNHGYEYVLRDLENYWPIVRTGGILSGDDVYEYVNDGHDSYHFWDGIKNVESSRSFGKYGVHNAVVDFCKKYNLRYTLFDKQFMIYKA